MGADPAPQQGFGGQACDRDPQSSHQSQRVGKVWVQEPSQSPEGFPGPALVERDVLKF